MAIATEDGLVAGLIAGPQPAFVKASLGTGKGAGTWASLWTAAGIPSAGAAPGSVNGAVPTSATTGALPFTNPTSPALSYLGRLSLGSQTLHTMRIYDRLWHNSGLSATLTTLQSITHPGLTRYTTGDQVELWVEIYTATTAAQTATVIYTNQAGTGSKSTTVAIPASTVVPQMIPVPLASGDTGFRSVQSVQLGGSMTAGNWGLTQVLPLASIQQSQNLGITYNAYDLGFPRVIDSACLAFMSLLSSTTLPSFSGEIVLAQG